MIIIGMKPLNQNKMEKLKTTPDFLPLDKVDFTKEQLIEMYDEVFSNTHSDSFKTAEMKDLLFDKDYWFMEIRKENWEESLKTKLQKFGITFKSE